MKKIILVLAILSAIILITSLIIFYNNILPNVSSMIWGILLIIIGILFLFLINNYRYNKKINLIIKSYKGKHKKEELNSNKHTNKTTSKGWNMNNSPFRKRKSGLTWGGGNIKGANAERSGRKSFLK